MDVLNDLKKNAGPAVLLELRRAVFKSTSIPIHILSYDKSTGNIVVGAEETDAAGPDQGTTLPQTNNAAAFKNNEWCLPSQEVSQTLRLSSNTNQHTMSAEVSDVTPLASPSVESEGLVLSSDNPEAHKHIWGTVKTKEAKERDDAATQLLISIMKRDDVQRKLNDKRTNKTGIYESVAREMKESGFTLKPDSAHQVHQKWRNIERNARNFINHSKATGVAPSRPPDHWDDLQPLLSKKHAITPVAITDTSKQIPQCTSVPNDKENEPDGCFADQPKVRKTKQSHSSQVLTMLKSVQDENKQAKLEQQKEREEMMNMFKTQHTERMENQRQWMQLFTKFMDTKEPDTKRPKMSD